MSKSFKTPRQVIYVCTGSKCKKKGGKDLGKLFGAMAKAAGLKDEVEIIRTECTDRCKYAAVISIQPQNIWLHDVNETMGTQIFTQYILNAVKSKSPSDPEA